MNRTYDIIIPVYNGYAFVKECYESIIKNTSEQHFIIFVDDGSTETELLDYYLTLEKHTQTIIIHQPENKGFIHSVNTGMEYSQNQIILLNSDTVVTKNWIEKIDTALFSSVAIGTATPWTNNGTICSFPDFCQDNELPSNISADQLSLFAEKTCDDFYPELPSAVGFCMAIKRELVEEIGLFNESAFGRGYGEENDFCLRATYAGYINILDNRTFIYHKGSLTFQGEKQQQLEINLAKLGQMHPNYFPLVEQFIADDPLLRHRQRMTRIIEAEVYNLPHILFLLHNDPLGNGINPPGGTEVHVLQIAQYLNENKLAAAYILVSSDNSLTFYEFYKNTSGKLKWNTQSVTLETRIFLNSKLNIQYKQFLDEILYSHHIDLIHIHHLIHHPHNINVYLDDWRGGLFYTLHDFNLLCPSHNLLNNKGLFCNGGSAKYCPNCASDLFDINLDIQHYWRSVQLDNLQMADRIYVPSTSSAEIICKNIPALTNKLTVRAHGSEHNQSTNFKRSSQNFHSPLNIAFLGGLSEVKGSQFIVKLLTSKQAEKFNWFLFGNIGDPNLSAIDRPNLTKFGRYKQDKLNQIIRDNKIDLIILCSIWPETFSYTLSEAWLAQCPVIVGPYGAPAERVKESGAGWVLDKLIAKNFFGLLNEILTKKGEYLNKLEKVKEVKIASIKSMVTSYYDDYIHAIKDKNLALFPTRVEVSSWNKNTLNPSGCNYTQNRDVAFLLQKSSTLTNINNEITQKNNEITQKNNDLNSQLKIIITSKSWKLTRPFRFIVRQLTSLLSRFKRK